MDILSWVFFLIQKLNKYQFEKNDHKKYYVSRITKIGIKKLTIELQQINLLQHIIYCQYVVSE
jgi:hypothetical protein